MVAAILMLSLTQGSAVLSGTPQLPPTGVYEVREKQGGPPADPGNDNGLKALKFFSVTTDGNDAIVRDLETGSEYRAIVNQDGNLVLAARGAGPITIKLTD